MSLSKADGFDSGFFESVADEQSAWLDYAMWSAEVSQDRDLHAEYAAFAEHRSERAALRLSTFEQIINDAEVANV